MGEYIVQPYSGGLMLPQSHQFSDKDAAQRQAAYYRRRGYKVKVFNNWPEYLTACENDENERAQQRKRWKEAEREL